MRKRDEVWAWDFAEVGQNEPCASVMRFGLGTLPKFGKMTWILSWGCFLLLLLRVDDREVYSDMGPETGPLDTWGSIRVYGVV